MNSTEPQKKQLKILLVLSFFYPHRGGSQKYAEEIYVAMMKRHPDVKVDVLCYNTDKVASFEEYRGFKVHRIPCWNIIPARFALPKPRGLIKILNQLAKNKYDYVNTHIRFFDPTWWVWKYAKRIGAKSFYTGHVAVHPVHQNKLVEIVSKIVDLTFAKSSLKFYDLITYTNQTAQAFFKKKLGVNKETHIVYGGIDTDFFTPTLNRTNRKIPKINTVITDDTVLVTFVGRFIWTKGVTYLYEAATKILDNTDKKVVFVLAGPGELEEKYRNKLAKSNYTEDILMTGNLSYEQVQELLSISDIFVNPSHHNEGFPNTVLEGGASGCYVIATDNAGTWEVIKNNQTGALIRQKSVEDLVDTINWALDNPQKRKELATTFRKRLVEEFDWKVISDQLYNLLKQKLT